jgi:hypothetical protein
MEPDAYDLLYGQIAKGDVVGEDVWIRRRLVDQIEYVLSIDPRYSRDVEIDDAKILLLILLNVRGNELFLQPDEAIRESGDVSLQRAEICVPQVCPSIRCNLL